MRSSVLNILALIALALLLLVGLPRDTHAQTLDDLQDRRDWGSEMADHPLLFEDGFAGLAALVPMGQPLEPPAVNPSDGVIVQPTTAGLAYWLPDDNLPVFTDGWSRWALTGDGLVSWQGDSLSPPPPAPVAPEPTLLSFADPKAYLYGKYPGNARLIDCLVSHESGWNALAVNKISVGREHATGLGQFLPSTWLSTPQGRAGQSIFDPYAQLDGMNWMIGQGRAREWATLPFCR